MENKRYTKRKWMILLVLFAGATCCQAFVPQAPPWKASCQERTTTVRYVAASSSSRPQSLWKPIALKSRNRHSKKKDEGRWLRAQDVEVRMLKTLEAMQNLVNHDGEKDSLELPPLFPSVRECNEALATFGDFDFLRALRLFVKMRKAASLAHPCKTQKHMAWNVPAPTLVTYSTLMSRAVHVGRPNVALRLWSLMKLQPEFFSNPRDTIATTVLVPDVKAANILMNAHAKLANVDEAFDLMRQMKYGNGTDVPATRPNIVTFNTLLHACQKAGDLDAALQAKAQLDESGIVPDARTFTSLIATVARKASHASGRNDPSPAFGFLNEMKSRNIRPNGMTYSALIDACGRCRRPDLALQGLRIMLRQKAAERGEGLLPNEVGAWTAAIDACGKAGRIQTARRLFGFMIRFGVRPNTITCGCLTDCLLKNGRTAETLEVLRYMKSQGIVPSEVMYTSLMTSAEKLVKIENQTPLDEDTPENDSTKAIEVYTELMRSLMKPKYGTDSDSLLVKVFLVFQEMKAVGATPDLACYNALLRACARAGDFNMGKDVLQRIRNDGLHPNDTSWRELIRAAAKTRQSNLAESIWSTACEYRGDDDEPASWQPSPESFGALASAYLIHASFTENVEEKKQLYKKVITMYQDVAIGTQDRRLHLIDRDSLQENPRSMLLVLQAIVGLADLTDNPKILRDLAASIVQLDCFASKGAAPLPHFINDNGAASRALQISRSWLASQASMS
jgi:pentatricopeptide repeat protein